jgi:hypothetical protein
MILPKAVPVLVACLCLSLVAPAQRVFPTPSTIPPSYTLDHVQDFSEIVVPITSVKITPDVGLGITGKLVPKLDIGANFGTGFCLDATCHFIVTNYHVAMTTRTKKIEGQKITQRYLATGPHDEGATPNILPNGTPLPYAKERDLAMFELRRSLPDHHGLTFSLDKLEVGQEVDIYGYPKGIINPTRKLSRFPATFKAWSTSGFLAFDYELSGDKPIRIRGASGGIVIDRKTEKIVGIMSETNETTALAVPVRTLVEFVSKVQPFLAHRVFPDIMDVSPLSADLYPRFITTRDHYSKFAPSRGEGLEHRPEEPQEVSVLREKAQLLAHSIRNFIALQSFAWGSGNDEPAARADYEVRVIDGVQRFRKYPNGEKQLENAAHPPRNGYVLPGYEWANLPEMVGTQYLLRIRQAPDVVVNERRMKVFQYSASVEDDLCSLEPIDDYLLFAVNKIVPVACYGEVWTDGESNIVRMSEHFDLSDKLKSYRGWETCETVITYGWLERANEPRRLVPQTLFVKAGYKKHITWCLGQFTDYRVFDSRVKIIAN